MADPIDLTLTFPEVTLDAWRAKVRAELGGREPESLRRRSLDGVEIEPLYTERGGERGRPGAPPFVRAASTARPWLVVHELSGDVESARRAIAEGAEALWVPRESDVDRAAIVALGAPVYAEASARVAGAITLSDPLCALAADASISIEAAMSELATLLASARASDPSARAILVSGVPYHEAGAGAAFELGLTIASGVEYLRALSEAGEPLADLPRRMIFSFALDADFFVGIAKLRAARLLWSKVLRTLGIDGVEQGMIVLARGSRRALSALDPHTNLLRGTASALAAIVGGAELVAVAPYDAPLGSPSALAERLARNTQLVLREEGHLGRVIDPAGGSYFLEALTDDLARGAWALLQEIEHLGGVARGLRDGSIAERALSAADARRRAMAHRELTRVGVNRYPSKEDVASPPAGSRSALAPMRDAEAFEALRASAKGARVTVLAIGDPRTLRARADFVREALEVAGMEITSLGPVPSASAAPKIETRAVVVCAADADYAEVLGALPLEGKYVVVAGKPSEELEAAAFLYSGADRVAVLTALAKEASS